MPFSLWFYHWVRNNNLAVSYTDLETVKSVLYEYLPQQTKCFSEYLLNPESASSWLKLILLTGELLRLQATPDHPYQLVAVTTAAGYFWPGLFETISSPEFSAARQALGIDKHWLLVFENIADPEPEPDKLMDALRKQVKNSAECAIIRFQ